MKIFEKLMCILLIASALLMVFSSFFFGIKLFEWAFGLSFITLTVSSLTLSAVEIASGELINPYDSDEYYIN